MAIFTGTNANDDISPGYVSFGVEAFPLGSVPSNEDDLLMGLGGNDYLDGTGGNDQLLGGDFGDTLLGGRGHDYILGDGSLFSGPESGDDHLVGGSGNDTLVGAGGNDTLIGGRGIREKDSLSGGSGYDYYQFDQFDYQFDSLNDSWTLDLYTDVIEDFDFGRFGTYGDKIDLSRIDAHEAAIGNQTFTFIGTAAFSQAGQVRVSNHSDGKTLISINADSWLDIDSQILVNDGHQVLAESWQASDFIL